jgi:hypothetical protein
MSCAGCQRQLTGIPGGLSWVLAVAVLPSAQHGWAAVASMCARLPFSSQPQRLALGLHTGQVLTVRGTAVHRLTSCCMM